jgi:hypothetical protein
LLAGHATIADEYEVGLGGPGDYSGYRLAMDVRPMRHRRDIGLVPAFSYFLTSREADAAAVVRSPAMISVTAADIARRGLVSHAAERVTAGSWARFGGHYDVKQVVVVDMDVDIDNPTKSNGRSRPLPGRSRSGYGLGSAGVQSIRRLKTASAPRWELMRPSRFQPNRWRSSTFTSRVLKTSISVACRNAIPRLHSRE